LTGAAKDLWSEYEVFSFADFVKRSREFYDAGFDFARLSQAGRSRDNQAWVKDKNAQPKFQL